MPSPFFIHSHPSRLLQARSLSGLLFPGCFTSLCPGTLSPMQSACGHVTFFSDLSVGGGFPLHWLSFQLSRPPGRNSVWGQGLRMEPSLCGEGLVTEVNVRIEVPALGSLIQTSSSIHKPCSHSLKGNSHCFLQGKCWAVQGGRSGGVVAGRVTSEEPSAPLTPTLGSTCSLFL